MKLKVFLPVLMIGLMISSLSMAQDQSKYGEDPETCGIKLSTYTEFFNQGNLNDAMPAWRWCFLNCPEATKNIYIHGTKIVEHFIANATVDSVKEAYVDTLMMVYDSRIQYFGQEGLVLGRKGVSMLKYRSGQVEEAYDVFAKSYELSGAKTEYFALKYYMNTAAVLFGDSKLTKENVVEIYSNVSDAISTQIANDSGKKLPKLEKAAADIEQIFVNSGAADCEAIISLFGPQFEENPDDLDLAKKIVGLLDRGKGEECQLSDLYMNTAVAVYAAEKTSSAAHSIGQGYFKRGDGANAEKYYKEAIELEEDPLKKADMYYEMGLLYYGTLKNYPAARNAARSAIGENPNHAKAYILIGKVYAASGCGETAFEKKSVNWLIVDQFVKAKSVTEDEDIINDANALIGRYSSKFPTLEEVFWLNYSEGQAITIGCWINETTTIRCIK